MGSKCKYRNLVSIVSNKPSNKLLAVLLALAIIITITGTLFTLQKLWYLQRSSLLITGAPSFSFGETNITVSSVTSLSLSGGNGTAISFGSGYVNGSCNACIMDSNGTSSNMFANGSNTSQDANQAVCCVSFTIPASGFLLENTGNTNLSVGYTCTGNCTHASYLGGARWPGQGGLEIKISRNNDMLQGGEEGAVDSAASCQGGGTLYRDNGWNVTNLTSYTIAGATARIGSGVYTSLSSIGHYLCGNSSNFPLAPDNTRDAAVIDINLTVLSDSGSNLGVRSSFRLTFNGSSSG